MERIFLSLSSSLNSASSHHPKAFFLRNDECLASKLGSATDLACSSQQIVSSFCSVTLSPKWNRCYSPTFQLCQVTYLHVIFCIQPGTATVITSWQKSMERPNDPGVLLIVKPKYTSQRSNPSPSVHSKNRVTSFLKARFYFFTFVRHFITCFRDLSWSSILSALFFSLFLSTFLDVFGPCFLALSATQKTGTAWGQRWHVCLSNALILFINVEFSSIRKGNAQIKRQAL